MNSTYFYKDKPLFGLDIGYGSIKVMQTIHRGKKKKPIIQGYGVASFDPGFLKDGQIVDIEGLAKVMQDLFAHQLLGKINTRRVAVTIPVARTFNRAMVLPPLNKKNLEAAVRLEAEQYIPIPLEELYLDYEVSKRNAKETLLLAVAAPKKIVDSYSAFMQVVGLEAVAFETTIAAASRLVSQAEQSDVPTVLIDLGSLSTDITIYDKGLIVTGTVPGGGDIFTQSISQKLGVTPRESHTIKTKYGMGVSKKQKEIIEALDPSLQQLAKEVRRMIRYYEERAQDNAKIGQVVTMGGGANMPGLTDYLTNLLRLPVRMCHPWQNLDFGKLQPPNTVEKSMYVTVAGLSLMPPEEVFV